MKVTGYGEISVFTISIHFRILQMWTYDIKQNNAFKILCPSGCPSIQMSYSNLSSEPNDLKESLLISIECQLERGQPANR